MSSSKILISLRQRTQRLCSCLLVLHLRVVRSWKVVDVI